MTYNVFSGTLNPAQSQSWTDMWIYFDRQEENCRNEETVKMRTSQFGD